MELKPPFILILSQRIILLIVPYGIETRNLVDEIDKHVLLLIVPYGIETGHIHHAFLHHIILLIVPYGIETNCRIAGILPVRAFNRTLWN